MLQAQTKDGKFVTLIHLSRKQIEQLRRKERFFCPVCSERVIVKSGTKVIPHFAHQSNRTCANQGEGPYHMLGKLRLKRWLQAQGINVELELYIKEINQRPDLFVKINDTEIAIEFQCARISIDEVRKRTINYQRLGIVPIWILGKNLLKKTNDELHVSPFILQFVHQFNEQTPTALFYFCPKSASFYLVTNLYLFTSFRAYHLLNIYHKNQLTFKQLVNHKQIDRVKLFSLWKKAICRFRFLTRQRVRGQELKWRTWLYKKRISIDHLPLYIYLPASLQLFMKVPPWNWQSRLCLDFIQPLPIGKTFTVNQCKQFLRRFMYPSDYYPLINRQPVIIQEYLTHLQQLNFIEQKDNEIFYKTNDLFLHDHIEEAIKYDNVFLNKLMYNYS